MADDERSKAIRIADSDEAILRFGVSGSRTVMPSGSAKTVVASTNWISCFLKFSPAFFWSSLQPRPVREFFLGLDLRRERAGGCKAVLGRPPWFRTALAVSSIP